MTTFIEIADCGVLQNRYYATADGSTLTSEQRAAINGHNSTGFCNAWITSFLNAGNPSVNGNCGSGWPAALTYSTTSSPPRPDGVRCTGADHDASMVGTFVDTDGNRKANQAGDNEGVQYGLKALQASPPKGITAEQFVRLNEGVGGYTPDLTWTGPSPAPGTPAPLNNVGRGTPACPVTSQGSPRQVAGGPLAENVFKCQLKPLDFSDPAYGGVAFTLDQQARLLATFPTGVCDWSKPGVSQVPEDGWTTFAAGPGGQPLGDAPTSVAVNQPPDARCRSITVSARGDVCSAVASVNNGSSDPDGDAVTVTQSPSGPYGLGAT